MEDRQAVMMAEVAEVLNKLSKVKKHPAPFLLQHTLFFLPILVVVSMGILALSLTLPPIYRLIRDKVVYRNYQPIALADDDDEGEDVPPPPAPSLPSRGLVADFTNHVRSFREYGTILFAMEVFRTLTLGALLGLSIYAAIQAESPVTSSGSESDLLNILKKKKKGHQKHKGHHDKSTIGDYSSLEWGEFGVCVFYTWTLALSFLLLTLRPATPLRRHLISHLDMLLFLGWLLFVYRDLWPLLTYHLTPVDLDNAITWSRIGLLSLAAVLVPLLRPRTYVPADPEDPTPTDQIHPEQTASWLSFLFYEFMTPLVRKAWKVPSLPYDDLQPMADYDRAKLLYKQNVPNLDPIKRKDSGKQQRHLFFLLLNNYKFEAVMTSLMCAFCAVFELSGSLAINQLLSYIELGEEKATLRPFVWIALLFVGPTIASLAIQYYVFLMTRALVRTESLLTQLLFDHALRLRMRDSTEDEEETNIDSGKGPVINVENVDGLGTNGHASANGASTEVGGTDTGKGTENDGQITANVESNKNKGQGLAGRINVLMAADVESVIEGRDLPLVFIFTPIQLVLCIVFLYKILSWSSLIGMLTMAVTMPLPGLFTKLNAKYQREKMEATDARVDSITEAVGALRMIKMFGWESRIQERIAGKREVELNMIWKRRLAELGANLCGIFLPTLTMTVTFAVYTVVQKQPLTASKVFTSMNIFELVKGQMGLVVYMINGFVTAGVSLGRINDFLHTTEMIDEFAEGNQVKPVIPEHIQAQQAGLIRIKNAIFTWGSRKGESTPDFQLTVPDVTFSRGKINVIAGPTGSGKSSLLKALIGELHFVPNIDGFYHLPRDGGVSYAAQESWCLSESIKANIIFGEPYDAQRYQDVLTACGLGPDLQLFDDGDETEIGEKGVTLSGGQKARITLARAVYCKTDVVLLDGPLMIDRTVLLVTHHVGLIAPIADYLLRFHNDGTIKSAGPINEAEVEESDDEEGTIIEDTAKEKKGDDLTAPEQADKVKNVANKLVKEEEKSEGRISKRAMFSFFSNFGGPAFWLVYFGLLGGGQAMAAFQTFWLGYWAKAYKQPGEVSIPYFLGLYVAWVVIGLVALGAGWVLYFVGAIKASREVHRKLVASIFGAYARFLDTTPVGRIISRFTKDMKSIDGSFTDTFASVAEMTFSLIIKFGTVVAFVPVFSLPAVLIGATGGIIGELYIHGQLSVKREMSNAKSPLFSHFSSAVNGIVSIRAFGAQDKMRAEAQKRADKYTRTARAFYNLNRWVTVRIDMLGGVFAAVLAAFLVYGSPLDASKAGFALSQAVSFSTLILWWVRMVNEMEVQGNAVERIEDYLVIDQEPVSVKSKEPPASWPTSGEIVLDGLSARYSSDGPVVLDDLRVTINSGEKVGIVGRTGSGKSTLALAILRMLPTSGSVIIDGLRTENINLHALRSHVTIIPQDPILLSGTLRFNLDPFGDHDDATLNDALQRSGLGATRHAESGAATPQRLTLDFAIAAGGGNLSQGQRQLVALARALVRQSKVLILDEATASVDFETDALIQQSIRDLPDTTTVLTVAHRLATVMDYDKILVLGKGKLLEYDSPEALKQNPESYFAKLVQAMEG